MTYEEFIQQYCIHNHGGEYDKDEKVIATAVRLANNLAKHNFFNIKNN